MHTYINTSLHRFRLLVCKYKPVQHKSATQQQQHNSLRLRTTQRRIPPSEAPDASPHIGADIHLLFSLVMRSLHDHKSIHPVAHLRTPPTCRKRRTNPQREERSRDAAVNHAEEDGEGPRSEWRRGHAQDPPGCSEGPRDRGPAAGSVASLVLFTVSYVILIIS